LTRSFASRCHFIGNKNRQETGHFFTKGKSLSEYKPNLDSLARAKEIRSAISTQTQLTRS